MWKSMYDRCYNERNHAYKNYGGKGVVVGEEWKTLNGFISTLDKVKGYDLNKIVKGEISLDKDSLVKGNREYSVDKCCFISREENNKIKPNQQRLIEAISPEGIKYTFSNQSEFSRTHNLTQSKVSECARGKIGQYRGWKFRIKSEVEEL